MNGSCHTYKWVVSHVWMSRLTRMDVSCHTCEWALRNLNWIHMCSYVSIHTCFYASCHAYEMSHTVSGVVSHMRMSAAEPELNSCVFIYAISHVFLRVMSHIWYESCHTVLGVVSQMRMNAAESELNSCVFEYAISRIWMSHVTYMIWVMSHIWMSHVTHLDESCHTYITHISHMIEHCGTRIEFKCFLLSFWKSEF